MEASAIPGWSDFFAAAQMGGIEGPRLLFGHVLPLVLPGAIIRVALDLGGIILAAAALGFLGLGVQPPTPSWGVLLTAAQQFLDQAPWLAIWPGVMIALSTLGFNLLGDGLRDALDPRSVR